jgi:hypothetical protein
MASLTKVGQRVSLTETVIDTFRCLAGVIVDGESLGIVAAGIEVAEQRSGQAGGVAGPTVG